MDYQDFTKAGHLKPIYHFRNSYFLICNKIT
jgi:hypothetical protein